MGHRLVAEGPAATPVPNPAAATAIPPNNAGARKDRRSLTVRRCAIIISPHRRNNTDASYARLSRTVQKLCPRYALQLDGLHAAHKPICTLPIRINRPNSVAAQSLSKMLLTMSSPIPMPAPVTIAWPNRPPRNRCSVPPPAGAGCWYCGWYGLGIAAVARTGRAAGSKAARTARRQRHGCRPVRGSLAGAPWWCSARRGSLVRSP